MDLLVIGWGRGGKTLAGTMARAGKRVAVVERSDAMIGGSCINIVCIPTKILVCDAENRRDSDDGGTQWGAGCAEVGRARASLSSDRPLTDGLSR